MAKKINQVTIVYDFETILEKLRLTNSEAIKTKDVLSKEHCVRTWYKDTYPDDELGDDIEGNLKWTDLLERMRCGEEVYVIIGVSDSLVRERVFRHLSELLAVPYDVIYYLWLHE